MRTVREARAPDDLFLRSKVTEGCVSLFALSCFASGSADVSPDARAHLATCAFCAASLAEEARAVAEAAREELPFRLVAAKRVRRRAPRAGLVAGCVALAASLAFFVLGKSPPPPPTERTKGTLEIALSVQRAGKLIFDRAPVPTVEGRLQDGDQLRLRVLGAPHASWVRLEGDEPIGIAPLWVIYADEPLSPDGWISAGVTKTGTRARLRVSLCSRAPAEGGRCIETVLSL